MNEVSISIRFEDFFYVSDAYYCTEKETKEHLQRLKDILKNEDQKYMFFSAGEETHFFNRGVLENSIVTLTIRPVENDILQHNESENT